MAVIQPNLKAVRRRQRAPRTIRITRNAITILFGLIAAINLGALISERAIFVQAHFVTAILSIYFIIEARIYLRRSDELGILSPVFLAVIFHFFISYLLAVTISVFYPSVLQGFGIWLLDLDTALSTTLKLTGLAAFCMFRGYAIGKRLAPPVRRSLQSTPLLRQDMRPAFAIALAMQAVYILAVAYAIQIGVYGLLSTVDTRASNQDIIQYLNLAIAAGTLSYFIIMLRYFGRREAKRASLVDALLIGVMITIHLIAGALSAFKTQIVLPFLIAGLAYYLATRRIPLRLFAFACFALFAAYVVIEPFRNYLGTQNALPSSLPEAIEALITTVEQRDRLTNETNRSIEEQIASRVDLSGMTTLAINYVDLDQLQEEKRREFQDSILLAPVLAYIPRILWTSKPSYSPGAWFNQAVRGKRNDTTTSVGMGPIGYLYMTGGMLAVAFGFLGFGVLQALIFEGFARAGAGGLIVFLCVMNPLVQIPSSFGPALVGVLQMLPVAILAQFILLRQSKAIIHDANPTGGRVQLAQ